MGSARVRELVKMGSVFSRHVKTAATCVLWIPIVTAPETASLILAIALTQPDSVQTALRYVWMVYARSQTAPQIFLTVSARTGLGALMESVYSWRVHRRFRLGFVRMDLSATREPAWRRRARLTTRLAFVLKTLRSAIQM